VRRRCVERRRLGIEFGSVERRIERLRLRLDVGLIELRLFGIVDVVRVRFRQLERRVFGAFVDVVGLERYRIERLGDLVRQHLL
jgi:hypothetical protein